jgi:hypothetical protein
MTIVLSFPQSGDRTVKAYFLRYVTPHWRWAFPPLGSSSRFGELRPEALCASLQPRQGQSQGVAFIDATLLAVCHPKRARRHKVFASLARWGRSSLGWCYGLNVSSR